MLHFPFQTSSLALSGVFVCSPIRSSVSLPSLLDPLQFVVAFFFLFILKYDFNLQSLKNPCWENKKYVFEMLLFVTEVELLAN